MDSLILLGKILQRFEDEGFSQVLGYKKFERMSEQAKLVVIRRENGNEVKIYFSKLLEGIKFYQEASDAYDEGPSRLREVGLTHITSPVWSLLHLIDKSQYTG